MLQINTFNDFEKSVLDSLSKKGFKAQSVKVVKNNDVQLHGIAIKDAINVSPNIYLDSFYDDYLSGRDYEDIIDGIIYIYEANKCEMDFDVSSITDWNKVKDRITGRLVNALTNTEYLANKPYVQLGDLAIIFQVVLEDGFSSSYDEVASVIVTNEILSHWGISINDLYEVSRKNKADASVRPIFEILAEKIDMPAEMLEEMQTGIKMTVITTKEGINGAIAVTYEEVLEDYYKENGEFYIIPSSTHEVIAVPASMVGSDRDLNGMIGEVNANEVKAGEVLSDHAYYYDGCLRLAKDGEIMTLVMH